MRLAMTSALVFALASSTVHAQEEDAPKETPKASTAKTPKADSPKATPNDQPSEAEPAHRETFAEGAAKTIARQKVLDEAKRQRRARDTQIRANFQRAQAEQAQAQQAEAEAQRAEAQRLALKRPPLMDPLVQYGLPKGTRFEGGGYRLPGTSRIIPFKRGQGLGSTYGNTGHPGFMGPFVGQ